TSINVPNRRLPEQTRFTLERHVPRRTAVPDTRWSPALSALPHPCFTPSKASSMFSHRVPADHSTNRLSAAIEERRAHGAPILDLTESNPTRCGFRQDEAALLRAFASPGALRYEP